MADLERGIAPDEQALLAANPELAGELLPYLESLRLLDGATRDIRLPRAGINGQRDDSDKSARQIGEYRIVRELCRGFGSATDRPVPQRSPSSGPIASSEYRSRFCRGTRAGRQLLRNAVHRR